jgi:hypothetical protein
MSEFVIIHVHRGLTTASWTFDSDEARDEFFMKYRDYDDERTIPSLPGRDYADSQETDTWVWVDGDNIEFVDGGHPESAQEG